MPEEVGNSPVVPKEVREAQLKQELEGLMSKGHWLGYRGLNDPIGEAEEIMTMLMEISMVE